MIQETMKFDIILSKTIDDEEVNYGITTLHIYYMEEM